MTAVLICGVDEAGRGPLAGPVYASAVILKRPNRIAGLKDSKQLNEGRREELALLIRAKALAWSIASASVEEIDALNIHHATLLAMKRAVEGLATTPGEVVVDGLHCPDVRYPARAIVNGDALVAEISAASILAKTARDAEMRELDRHFPYYGFAQHKGYATAAHLQALSLHGACPAHRRSYAPVAKLLDGHETDQFPREYGF